MDLLYVASMMITCIASLGLASFFKAEDNPRLTFAWRSVMVATAWWGFARAMFNISSQPDTALIWVRLAYVSTIWLGPIFAWLVFELLQKPIPKKTFIRVGILFTVFTILAFTPLFIGGMSPKLNFRLYDDSPGPAYTIFSFCFTGVLVWPHFILYREMKQGSQLLRKRIKFFFLASLMGFGGSATTFPLVYDIKLYPFGVPVIALFPIFLTYAVVRFLLMDLYLLLRDTTVHVISSLLIGTVFIVFAFSFGQKWIYVTNILVLVVLLPIIYPHVSKWVRKNVNRTRWGEVDRYLDDIEERSSLVIGASLSIASLSQATLDLIISIFPVEEASVYFMRSKTQSLHLYARKGLQNNVIDIPKSLPVFKLISDAGDIILRWNNHHDHEVKSFPLVEFFNETKGEILEPIFIRKQLTGLLVMGPKISGQKYHRKDVEALRLLSSKVEIACGYAMASEKYTVAQGEWSHSLNQITKPIEQKAGMIKEIFDLLSPEEIKEAAGVIIKRTMQLRQVHEYFTNTSAISREVITGEFKKEKVDLSEFLKKYIDNFKVENKGIIQSNVENKLIYANVNRTGIERVLLEIISNSLRHTQFRGAEARIVIKDNLSAGNYEVKISDNGDGIDPNDIDRIWEPGWQQKDMNAGASGLGLAICKQIIDAHEGKITAHSSGKDHGMEIIFTIPILTDTEKA